MRILTLIFSFAIMAVTTSLAQVGPNEGIYLHDLKTVVTVGDDLTTFEKDGKVWLEVKKAKKADQIEVTHVMGEGSYSTGLYYLSPEGLVIDGKRNVYALPDGEWTYFKNDKPVKRKWFVRGELVKEKDL